MNKLVCSMVALLLLPYILFASGVKYNATDSLAHGLYRVVDKKAENGDYAWFCPPDNHMVAEALRRGYIAPGNCPGGYIHFMKKVMATEGSIVTINNSGVYVDGDFLEHSKPVEKDYNKRPLFINYLTDYRMGKDEYLMMTDCNAKSFDARYFGIVKGSNIFKLEQVITWRM